MTRWRVLLAGVVSGLLLLAHFYAPRPEIREAEAQGVGILSRATCTSINVPVQGQTFCFEQSTNSLKFWTGAAWVQATATQSGVNNVRDFGAVCNDANDDSVAIQAALTAVPSTGGIVFIPGRCAHSATLTPNAETLIVGTGKTSSRLRFTSTTASAIQINAASKTRVQIRDLWLRVNGNDQIAFEASDTPEFTIWSTLFDSGTTGAGIGLRIRASGPSGSFSGNVFASHFENLRIGAYVGVAADGAGANVENFYSPKFTSNGTGLFIEKSTTTNVWGGRFENNTAYGIDTASGTGVVCNNLNINSSYFESNATNHYRIRAGCSDTLISNPTIVGGTFSDLGTNTKFIGNANGTPVMIAMYTAGANTSLISQAGALTVTSINGPTVFNSDIAFGSGASGSQRIGFVNTGDLSWDSITATPYSGNTELMSLTRNGSFRVGSGLTDQNGGTVSVASALYLNNVPFAVASGASPNLTNLRGLSASSSLSNNLRGACSFPAAVTCAVTFAANEPDAHYFVITSGLVNVTAKARTGFTLTATGTTSQVVDWFLVR